MYRSKIFPFLVASTLLIVTLLILGGLYNTDVRPKNAEAMRIPRKPTDIRIRPTSTPVPVITYAQIPSKTPTPTLRPTNLPTPTPQPTSLPTPTPTSTSSSSQTVSAYLLQQVNGYRKSQGLPEVSSNDDTCSFASTRAQEIATNFNHDGFTNRMNNKNLPYPSYSEVTENIAMNSNYKDVVNQWINSSGHAENMRRNTPFVCIMQSGNYYAYEGLKP